MPIHNYTCSDPMCANEMPNQFRHLSEGNPTCSVCGGTTIKQFTSQISISIQEPWRHSKDRLSVHSQNKRKP